MKKVVHVGQMKSGTTYIQNACSANRKSLYGKGLFYPGPNFNHQHACYGICGENIPWVNNVKPLWASLGDDLINQVNSEECTSLISCEALSCLDKDGVNYFVKKIGGVDEVIVTVRNFHSVLLSAWQQIVKGGATNSLPEFFDRLKSTRESGSGLWRNYAFGTTVENWSPHARVTILVSSGKRVLEDFFNIVGVQGVVYEKENAKLGNMSLLREDVELLRALNKINYRMGKDAREAYVRYLLDEYFFPAANKRQGSNIKLPNKYIDLVEAWCSEEMEKIRKIHDVNVVGDESSISEIVKEKISCDDSDFLDDPIKRLSFHLESVSSKTR